jgi:hypothetical protein
MLELREIFLRSRHGWKSRWIMRRFTIADKHNPPDFAWHIPRAAQSFDHLIGGDE